MSRIEGPYSQDFQFYSSCNCGQRLHHIVDTRYGLRIHCTHCGKVQLINANTFPAAQSAYKDQYKCRSKQCSQCTAMDIEWTDRDGNWPSTPFLCAACAAHSAAPQLFPGTSTGADAPGVKPKKAQMSLQEWADAWNQSYREGDEGDEDNKKDPAKPTYIGTPVEETRKKQGRCPKCGELGHFSNFQFVCSKHGPY